MKPVAILIVLVIGVALASFIFLNEGGTAANVCEGNRQRVGGGIPCEGAVASALTRYPGDVNAIQYVTIQFREGPEGEFRFLEVWLVDINVEESIETPAGLKERIVVAIDPTSTYTPFVERFFDKAL